MSDTESYTEQRLQICEQCPSFQKTIKICKECGCFMQVKTKMKNAKCHYDHWNNPEIREKHKTS